MPGTIDAWPGQNLGFEQVSGERPAGWTGRGGYEWAAVRDDKHGGERSLRLRSAGSSGSGAVTLTVPAAAARGRIVRLRGFLKTRDTRGLAGLVLTARGGGGVLVSDRMPWARLDGTADWTEASVEIWVPEQAETLELGGRLVGEGTAWFDDLALDVIDRRKQRGRPIVLAGAVVDAAGAPVAGAEVALHTGEGVARHLRADAGGRFRFDATVGAWGFAASHPGHVGSFVDTRRFSADATALTLKLGRLGGGDSVTVHGTIGPGKPAPGSYVHIGIVSNHDSDGFPIPVGADGTFEVTLPRGPRYYALPLSPLRPLVFATPSGDRADRAEIAIELPAQGSPPPPALAPWIGAHAIPLATTEAGHGSRDLAPLSGRLGRARVIALGHATYGTRELVLLEHRLLEHLVAAQGVTALAIEADPAECRALDAYVMGGAGDPRVALDRLHDWAFATEEALALIEWTRAWNAAPAHRAKIRIHGYDVRTPRAAYAGVADFLARVAPEAAPGLLVSISALSHHTAAAVIARQPQTHVDGLAAGLRALRAAFDRGGPAWSRRASPAALDQARHDVTLLEQAVELALAARAGQSDAAPRGRAMAANVLWILEHQPAGGRVLVWGHNERVARDRGHDRMGEQLRARLGAGYLAIGSVLAQGSFRAFASAPLGVTEVTLGAPPEADAGAVLAGAGKPLMALDLGAVPARGPVHDWFAAAHPVRQAGATWGGEAEEAASAVLADRYDALIVLERTTATRPVDLP